MDKSLHAFIYIVTWPDTRRPMGSVTAGKVIILILLHACVHVTCVQFQYHNTPPYKDPLTYMSYKHKFSYTTKLRESILQVKIRELKTTKIKI